MLPPLARKRILPRSAAFLLLVLLGACGGGGGGGSAIRVVGNLGMGALTVRSSQPTPGHEVELGVSLHATETVADVPVSFFLMHKGDADQKVGDPRQVPVGSTVFAEVAEGTGTQVAVVTLPATVAPVGEWYLIAHLDPEDVLRETNENDNLTPMSGRVVVELDGTNTNLADVVLEEAVIEQSAVVLYPEGASRQAVGGIPDAQDHDFGATLRITSTGRNVVQNLDLTVKVTIPTYGVFQARIWDPQAGAYVNELATTITPGIPNTVHLDVFIAGSARRHIDTRLRAGQPNVYVVTFTANGSGRTAEWELGCRRHAQRNDNMIDANVVIVLPPTPPQRTVAFDTGFRKEWVNPSFTAGIGLQASLTLDQAGVTGRARAQVPVKLLGTESRLLDVRSYGRVLPRDGQPTQSQFNFDVDVLGQTVYSRSSTNPTYTHTEDWSITRTVEARGKVFVGPVPIDLVAGVTGTLGFRVNLTMDPARLDLSAGPYLDTRAYAQASVSAVVVTVGVRGTMTILKDTFTARSAAALTLPTPTTLRGALTFQVSNELVGPEGRIWLFADRKVPKWCWNVVPCGVSTVTDERTLVRFQTFRKSDVFEHRVQTSTVDL
ncbi:MAG: hypothetical protein IT458_15625 [Planctomycetes bacterium]|nr:hypothetical protein [Planctomycetota bacterium]